MRGKFLVFFVAFMSVVYASEGNNVLVVYYSLSGNTKAIAEKVQKLTGGDIFELVMETPYPADDKKAHEAAKADIDNKSTPPLRNPIESIEQYEIIYVGSPVWYGTIASPVRTFLISYDFSGKVVVPFVTHGGGGKGKTDEEIKDIVKAREILPAEKFYKKGIMPDSVEKWVKNIKY